jgi:hypothetical protein
MTNLARVRKKATASQRRGSAPALPRPTSSATAAAKTIA